MVYSLILMLLASASLLVCLINHNPLFLVLWLIFTTLLTSIVSGFFSSWLMYSLMLLYLGGMMVLFVYMVSLVSSGKVLFKKVFALLPLLLVVCLFSFVKELGLKTCGVLGELYSWMNAPLMFLVGVYLLFSLMMVVKLTSSWRGGVKSLFKNG